MTTSSSTFRPGHNHDTFRSSCGNDCPRRAWETTRMREQLAVTQSAPENHMYRGYTIAPRDEDGYRAISFGGEYVDTVWGMREARSRIDHWIEGSVR